MYLSKATKKITGCFFEFMSLKTYSSMKWIFFPQVWENRKTLLLVFISTSLLIILSKVNNHTKTFTLQLTISNGFIKQTVHSSMLIKLAVISGSPSLPSGYHVNIQNFVDIIWLCNLALGNEVIKAKLSPDDFASPAKASEQLHCSSFVWGNLGYNIVKQNTCD